MSVRASKISKTPALACRILVLLVAFGGCDDFGSGRTAPGRCAVVLVGTRSDDPVWQAVRAGAARFSREARNLRLEEVLPSTSTPIAQKTALERIETPSVPTVACVLAIDARLLVQPIRRFMARGTQVVLIGDDAPQTRRRVFVGADEQAVGEAIGETLASLCKTRRTVMVVHDDRGSERSVLRHEGFQRARLMHPDLRVLREFDCLGDRGKALKLLYETSERFPDLGGWALLDDWLRDGVPADRRLLHGAARIVSYGTVPGNLRLLEDGRVHALVGVDWEALGYRAVQLAYQLLSLSVLPVRDYKAPPVVVTKENLAEYRTRWQGIISRPASQPGAHSGGRPTGTPRTDRSRQTP